MKISKKNILLKVAKDTFFAPGIPYHKGTSEIPKTENKVFEYAVQKHLADRAGLHYDVRLGNPDTGVGHSFVVRTMPKPGEKILANQTVDHVIPYFDFVGRIKKGYGKGVVRRHSRGLVDIKSSSPEKITFITREDKPKKYSLVHLDGKKWLMVHSKLNKTAADLKTAKSLTSELYKQLRPYAYKMSTVGSISRGHEQVNDIDLVVWPKKTFSEVVQKIGLSGGGDKVIKSEYKGVPVNIFITNKESYEPTRLHFGIGKHIIRLKGEAKKRGLKLNRHGLFQDSKLISNKESFIRGELEKKAIDPLTLAGIAGAGHVATNMGLSALYKSKTGGKLLGSMTTHGFNQGLKGTKMSPTLDRVFRYGVGPESLADYSVGKKVGKFTRIMKKYSPEDRSRFVQKYLHKATGGKSSEYNDLIKSTSKVDYNAIKSTTDLNKFKTPLINEVKKIPGTTGVVNALEGNTNKTFSKWLSRRKEVGEKVKPSKLTNITHGVIGAGLVANPIGGAEFGAQMGLNVVRDKISKTKFGDNYLKKSFQNAYEEGKSGKVSRMSKFKTTASKLLLSPRAGEIREAGNYLGSQETNVRKKIAPIIQSLDNTGKLQKKIDRFNIFKKVPGSKENFLLRMKDKLTHPIDKGKTMIQNLIDKSKKNPGVKSA